MFEPIFLFFDISTGEIVIILMVVFIVFGPSKIPELSKKIGRGIYEIKRASNEIKREIDSEVRKLERDVDIDIDIEPKKSVKKHTAKKIEEKSETETAENK